MKHLKSFLASIALLMLGLPATAQDIKVGLIISKTGPTDIYAKQVEAGINLGFEYMTSGTMVLDGRKIVVLVKDDQGKPDLAKSLLEKAYYDDNVDIATGGTSSAVALAMLSVAEEAKKVLIVDPAVADSITGEKWNRYIFRTSRNSTMDALTWAKVLGTGDVSVATLAQDYAFGRDGVAALKDAIAAVKSPAKVVFEEYAPINTTDFTAPMQRIFDALKDKPGRKVLLVNWAGQSPVPKIMDLKPERFGIELTTPGYQLAALPPFKKFPGIQGPIHYYYKFPKNAMNDWLVTEHQKRFGSPPDLFTGDGMFIASAIVTAIKKAGGTDTEKLIAALEGLEFDSPKGKIVIRKEDHQALMSMYQWKVKADPKDDFDILELVKEFSVDELPLPIRNRR